MERALAEVISTAIEYYSDAFIWGITLLGIPSMMLWSWPNKLTTTGRRGTAAILIIFGLLASAASIYQKAKANQEIRLLTEGGGSVPRIIPKFENGYLSLIIQNTGDYALLDLEIQLTDHEWMQEMANHFKTIRKPYTIEDFYFGPIRSGGTWNIRKKGQKLLYRVKKVENGVKEMNFTFDITTRSADFQQKSKMIKAGEFWNIQNEVTAFGNTTISTMTVVANSPLMRL